MTSHLLSRYVKVKIYKTLILPVVLYGCEIWSFILRDEYRLRVFENRVLRRIFGPKRDDVTGACPRGAPMVLWGGSYLYGGHLF
jgi:hypothetical protein